MKKINNLLLKNILLFILFILEIVASSALASIIIYKILINNTNISLLVICLYLFAIIAIIGFSFYLGVKIIEKIS